MRSNAIAIVSAGALIFLCASVNPIAAASPKNKLPVPPPVKHVPIDPLLQEAARAQLNEAFKSSDPFVRMHAVESWKMADGAAAQDRLIRALRDPDPGVRFAALMACGDLDLAEAKELALGMVNDDNPAVRIASRYVLHRLGDTRFSHDLEGTSRDPDLWTRRKTVVVLGLLGEPSAVKLLKPLQNDPDPGVRLQVAEALWRLGDAEGLKTLVAATISKFPDDQMLALLALAATKDSKIIGHLQQALTDHYVEVALVAARAMGELGSDQGFGIALEAVQGKDNRQRVLGALALGAIGRPDAQEALGLLLKVEDVADVRISAAVALLQIGHAAH